MHIMCVCVCAFYHVSICMTFDLSVSFIENVQVRGHGLGLGDDNMMYVICIPLNLCRVCTTFIRNSRTVWDICANVSTGFCVVLIYVLPLNLCRVCMTSILNFLTVWDICTNVSAV